tara:strand:- start:1420 stop:1665 length:246 start_codon:yes stop_codon:yes gene_type:complete
MFKDKCEMSVFLAYGMSAYVIASFYYLLFTRAIGTPFIDSLSESQLKIKENSANKRRAIFYSGIILAVGVLYYFAPFSECA